MPAVLEEVESQELQAAYRFARSGPEECYGIIVMNDPINLVDPLGLYWFRQPWQTPGVVGRRDTPVPPRGRVSEFIEKYVPAGYTFGEMHDNFVDVATRGGISDGKINVPSMLSMYGMAISKELLRTNRILDQPTQPTPCK